MDASNKIIKFATTFDRIEEIIIMLSNLDCGRLEGETTDAYKKRIENLYLPLISQLEGVNIVWSIPAYSAIDEVFSPENTGEEVIYIDTTASPVRELINSVMSKLSVNFNVKYKYLSREWQNKSYQP